MFTIEVEKRRKDEEFSFEDVWESARVTHDDCYGGPVKWYIGGGWHFQCQRCGKRSILIYRDSLSNIESARTDVVKTAVDGQERRIGANVRVIQKS